MGINRGGIFDDTNTTYISRVVTVGATEVKAVANADGITNLEGRQEIFVFNASNKTIFYGPTGVTTKSTGGVTEGIPLEPDDTLNIPLNQATELFLITDSPNNDVIVQEMG